ncbi:hypothetical protein HBI04_047220 [Parastagonospora nodorum]|nr:hypothetical protein HBI03_171420 [Parastagonospora nodorum]KAH4280698.1 hypothetical protein HBI04_047220 [Parastagonospora nodorum]KAH5072620.1 hypothetical protein HBH95_164290 [Parastagonospora nodorum]
MADDERKQQKSSTRFPVKSTPRSKAEDHDDPSTAERSTTSIKPPTYSAPNTPAYARGTQSSTGKQIDDEQTSSSFALKTKASKEKQADRGLSTPKKKTARTTSAANRREGVGSANATPSVPTRRQKGKGKQLETPLPEPGARNGGVNDQNAQPSRPDEQPESRECKEAPLSQSTSAKDPRTEEIERKMQDEELMDEIAEFERGVEEDRLKGQRDGPLEAELQDANGVNIEDAVSSNEEESGLPVVIQGEVEAHESTKQQNPKQKEQDLPKSEVQSVEIKNIYELQRRNQKLENAIIKLQQRNQKLEDYLADTEIVATNAAIEQEEAALAEIGALRKAVKNLNQDVRTKDDELDEAKASTSTSSEKLTRLRDDVEYLANALKKTNAGDAPKTKTLRDLRWKPYSSPEATDLHMHIARFTIFMEEKLQAASTDLDVRNEELATAQKDIQALEQSEKYWKALMEKEQKKREQVECRLADWKVKAEAMYQPDLGEKNRELQTDLYTSQDKNARLQEQTKTLRERAQRWEAEFKSIKSRAEKESEGFVLAYEQQRKDMMVCMKEYLEKLNDPANFDLKPLHEKVRTLERDLQVTTEAFDAVKMSKARVEEDVLPKILGQMREYEVEIEGLRDAWARDAPVRAAYAFKAKKGYRSDTFTSKQIMENEASQEKTSKSPARRDSAIAPPKKFKHVPRCLHPKETAQREAELQQLRKKQDARNASQHNFGIIMKRVHRWQMEDSLWDKQGWSYWLGKSSWDIWDGAGWMSDVQLDMETKTILVGLQEQGILDV